MATPRENRLLSDLHKVEDLVSKSGGTLILVRKDFYPPTRYVIEYHCPSLIKEVGGGLSIRNSHLVEITLGMNYPIEKPTGRMLTPIFNPHVFPHQAICLGGVWSAAETLDVLILRIGALLQLDPRVLDSNSPANLEANQWVGRNRNKIPLGNVSFKAQPPTNPRISWS